MLGIGLVRPLEDDWRAVLDAVGRARGWPTSADVPRLAARVADLSAAYNDASRARASMRDAGAARLAFSLPRDVPKGAAAVRELVATGALTMPADRALRVLDVGAGLGATTWGLSRALEAAGQRGTIEATWVDTDGEALELGAAVARARAAEGAPDGATRGRRPVAPEAGTEGRGIVVRVRTFARRLEDVAALGRFDVVLIGQVLSELDVGQADALRLERHVALVEGVLERHVEPGGALVVIEPALRDRTRHLHRVRDGLLARGVTLFAPCLHAAPCPALARETDWCHEHVSIDLPAWLAPVARAAGLRREGLGFSYVVLRKDGVRLVDRLASAAVGIRAVHLRVVSEPMPSKGKRELFLCGEFAAPDRIRVTRLDRDRTAENAVWDDLERGDVAIVAPPPDSARPRIGSASSVSRSVARPAHSGDAESR